MNRLVAAQDQVEVNAPEFDPKWHMDGHGFGWIRGPWIVGCDRSKFVTFA
jgi:hypothetical protein